VFVKPLSAFGCSSGVPNYSFTATKQPLHPLRLAQHPNTRRPRENVMNIQAFLLLSIISVVAIAGCGHTNKLAKHNVGGKTAIYRTYTTASAGSYAYVESPTKSNTVVDILAAIGSGIASDQGRKKLQKAINGDSIAQAVGRGISEATVDYLRLQPCCQHRR